MRKYQDLGVPLNLTIKVKGMVHKKFKKNIYYLNYKAKLRDGGIVIKSVLTTALDSPMQI